MLHLVTLGGLGLVDDAGADCAIPKRRLALLALLASAGSRGLTRDKIVAYLWPESSSDDARHSLEQLLYSLRRQLGAQVLAGTDPLRLNGNVISADIAVFDAALACDADAEAVAAYRGPFLDGFYLRDADEFGRWVEEERSRRAAAYGAALERVAEHAARSGDGHGVVAAWRGLVALDRLSARHALGLIRALAAAGDRPGALRTAAAYEALVQEELGIPLEPSIATFVRSLRNGNAGVSGDAATEGPSASAAPPPDASMTALSRTAERSASTPLAGRVRRPRVFAAWVALGVVGAAAMLWVVAATRSHPLVSSAAELPRVAVLVFENDTGDSTLDEIGVKVADYTRIALHNTGLVDPIDPAFDFWMLSNAQPSHRVNIPALIRQTGATIIVRGAYYLDADSLRFSGQGIESKTGRVFFAFDSVKVGRVKRLGVLEIVRERVTSGIATHVDPALRAWAGSKGKPPVRLDAYEEFAEGMTNFVSAITEPGESSQRPRLFTVARGHLERAFRLDSTYFVAALWLFWSRYNAGDQSGADSVVTALKPRRASMSPYERVLYDYNDALMHKAPQQRYELDKKLLAYAPASEFNYCLARDALEANSPRDALDVLARLDSSYSWMRFMAPPPGFRVRALVQLGDYARALALSRQTHDRVRDDLSSAYPEMDALAALGRLDEIEQVVGRFHGRSTPNDPMSANVMLYAGLRLHFAGRADPARKLFERALRAYSRDPASGIAGDVILFGRGRSLYYLGRWAEARVAFEQLAGTVSNSSRNSRSALVFLGSLAARRGDSAEVSRIRGLLRDSSVNPAIAEYFEARVAAIAGDDDRALELLLQAVRDGAQADELVTQGDAAASMEPDFARLRRSPAFRTALGRW